jgi:hypothetical protein
VQKEATGIWGGGRWWEGEVARGERREGVGGGELWEGRSVEEELGVWEVSVEREVGDA